MCRAGAAASVTGAVDMATMRWRMFYTPPEWETHDSTYSRKSCPCGQGGLLVNPACSPEKSTRGGSSVQADADVAFSPGQESPPVMERSAARSIFPLSCPQMINLLTQMNMTSDAMRDFTLATACSEYDIYPSADVTSSENRLILSLLHDAEHRVRNLSCEKDSSIILHISEFDSPTPSCSSSSLLRDRMRSSEGVLMRMSTKDSFGGSFNADDFVRVDWLHLPQDGLFLMMFLRASFQGEEGEEVPGHADGMFMSITTPYWYA